MGKALAQIQPGDLPQIEVLKLSYNSFNYGPDDAMQGLSHFNLIRHLDLHTCNLIQ